MEVRLGQVLIESGVLSVEQSEQILDEQDRTGEPFGLLCERLFGIDPETVERAWALQYAGMARTIDPLGEPTDPLAMELVTRRQAWQFRVLPLRFDGRELMIATTKRHLRRALRFATGVLGVPAFIVLASSTGLGEALCRYYPQPGMSPTSVDDDYLDSLLSR